MFPISSTNEEKVLVSINPTTAAGNPATVDGVPVWTVVSGDCTVEPLADGLSCYIVSGQPNVANLIEVSADADLDAEEVRTITETIVYTVVAAEAQALGIVSAVEPK
jgi:hypothetical protein